jgi:hypothetical protein
MKNTLLTICSVIALSGFAQTSISLVNMENNASIAANSVVNIITYPDSLRTVNIDIKNNGSSTHVYDVLRYDMMLNSSGPNVANAYFCLAGECFSPGNYRSLKSLTLSAGQSASQIPDANHIEYQLITDLMEISHVGFSYVKYSVVNIANVSDSIQFTIKYNDATILGVSNNKAKDLAFQVSPNPAKGNVSLKFGNGSQASAKVQIYNSLGAVVLDREISGGTNTASINVEHLTAGVYFINLRQGELTATRKLVIE